jgi:trehalose-phosphatase
MRYLFHNLERIKKSLKGKFLFLFLDCDGTLAPIADTPDKAVIPQEARILLDLLSHKNNCRIAIISGRNLADIKKRIGLKDIIYSGNHGFQIEGTKIKHELAIPAGYKEVLRRIKANLEKKLSGINGVFVEDKKLSLALHFRLVDKKQLPFVKTAFHESIALYLVRNKIKLSSGKKILEVRPPIYWDKGRAVLWLLARRQFISGAKKVFPIYLGDDITDEDAFKALGRKGLTVFVGKTGSSGAAYYLKNTEEVIKFLRLIADLKYN